MDLFWERFRVGYNDYFFPHLNQLNTTVGQIICWCQTDITSKIIFRGAFDIGDFTFADCFNKPFGAFNIIFVHIGVATDDTSSVIKDYFFKTREHGRSFCKCFC